MRDGQQQQTRGRQDEKYSDCTTTNLLTQIPWILYKKKQNAIIKNVPQSVVVVDHEAKNPKQFISRLLVMLPTNLWPGFVVWLMR
jgi:hypothetical protein